LTSLNFKFSFHKIEIRSPVFLGFVMRIKESVNACKELGRKSKPHEDSTSLLLEWLPSRTQTTTNVGKDVGKKKPDMLLLGM
jgi:hypothetical protein